MIAVLTDRLHHLGITGIHASFALKRLDQHRGHAWTVLFQALEQLFEIREIVVSEEFEAFHHGFKTLVVSGLSRGADRGQRAPMEAGRSSDDHRPFNAPAQMTVFPGQFDRRFVGLSP